MIIPAVMVEVDSPDKKHEIDFSLFYARICTALLSPSVLDGFPAGGLKNAPPQSACFSLVPEGESGESYEDLESYFCRLSACHGLFPRPFAARAVGPLFHGQEVRTPNFGRYVVMNGVTGSAVAWVDALEKLTMRTDLTLRTLLPLRTPVPCFKLLSKEERF